MRLVPRFARCPAAARLAASLAALVGFVPAAHGQLGIAAGLNYDRLGDIEASSARTTFDNAEGRHVGVFVNLDLGPVGLRPGVFYTDLGRFRSTDKTLAAQAALVEVPLDVKLRLPAPVVKPYVVGGPVLRFVAKNDGGVDFERFTYAGAAGLGVELSLLGFRPFVEGRYQFGAQRFVKDAFTVGGVTFTASDDARLNQVLLRAGVTF